MLTEMSPTIGENQTCAAPQSLEVGQGAVGAYVHNQGAPGLGKIGVLVALESRRPPTSSNAARQAAGACISPRLIPQALDGDGLDPAR